MELADYEKQLLEQKSVEKSTRKPLSKNGLNWEKISETLEEVLDFSKPTVDNEIVDKFIARIIPQGNNHFTWFVNLSALKTEEIDMVVEGRKTNPTIHIEDNHAKESEDDESSLHTDKTILMEPAASLQGEKYSPLATQHRQRLLRSRILK